MREELTIHQRLNVMIAVAADRVNRLTNMTTSQCTRTWHMQTITFLLNVSNNLSVAKQECKKMQENKDQIVLDCMKIKVTDCEEIFKYPHDKELSRLYKGELETNEYTGIIERFCRKYIKDKGKAFMQMLI